MSIPTLVVEFSRDAVVGGAELDDTTSGLLDSAVLGPVTATFTEDISEFAREASTDRGAQRELERIEAGTATVVLDDRDSRFTPFNTGSPYYPDIVPMRRMRIFGTWPPASPSSVLYDSATTTYDAAVPYGGAGDRFPIFYGFVESWPVQFPGDKDMESQVRLVDGMKLLSLAFVSGDFPQQGSGARIAAILDAVSWLAAERDLDVGTATVPAITLENVSALEHIQQIAHAEGGRFFMGKDGFAVFREAVEVNPDLSSRTWSDDGTGMSYREVTLVCNDDLILNDVHLTRTGGTEQIATDPTSQNDYGIRSSAETDIQLLDDAAVLTRAELQVSRYAQPVMRLESLVDDAMQHDLWNQVFARDINDIVKAIESRTGTSQVSSVEGISHSMARDGSWTVTLSLAPSALVTAGILDDATYGLLDSTAILT